MAAPKDQLSIVEATDGDEDGLTGSRLLSEASQDQNNSPEEHLTPHIEGEVDAELRATLEEHPEKEAANDGSSGSHPLAGPSSSPSSLSSEKESSSRHSSVESLHYHRYRPYDSEDEYDYDTDPSDPTSDGESDAASFDGASSTASSVRASNETTNSEDSKTTPDLTGDLKTLFDSHRQKIRGEIRDLKGKDQKRLFSDSEIDLQLLRTAATTPPQTATDGPLHHTQRELDDGKFGHRVIVGHFSIPGKKHESNVFEKDEIRISQVEEHLESFSESEGSKSESSKSKSSKSKRSDSDSSDSESSKSEGNQSTDLFWVHLPVNNLLWVEEVMLALLNRKYNKPAQSKKVLSRCLRRERNAIQRAFEREAPTTKQALLSTCRKIRLSGTRRSGGHDILTYMMPYLHWERSLSNLHSSKIIKDSQEVAKTISKKYKRQTLKAEEVSELPCTRFEKMVRYHSIGRPGLVMRQTLDQVYYQNLDTTESRDLDQVVEKYSRKQPWKDHAHRVLMVDQLWLWIIDDDIVLTCFPNSFPNPIAEDKIERHDILASLLKYFDTSSKRRWIRNAHQLAYCIIDRCASSVYDRELHVDEKFDFLGMFEQSIASVMEQQSRLYAQFSQDLQRKHTTHDIEAVAEFRLLEEAKDILDELRIMRDINSRQSALIRKLSGLAPSDRPHKRQHYFLTDRPAERTEVMKEMVDSAKSAYEVIIHLIDLKQKQGNLSQAAGIRDLLKSNNALTSSSQKILDSTRDTLEQSKKSGETLMVFTVVTILFLPLSTLASFFSLNARELNDGHLTIRVVFAYILPLSAFIVFLSLLFGFSKSARESLPWVPSTRRGHRGKA